MPWYLAASKPREELRAMENLDNQGVNAFCPVMKVEKIHSGKRKIVIEAMFSGYVFIQLCPEDALWHKVRSTRGVRDWVRFAGKVAKVPEDLVEAMIKQNKQQKQAVVKKHFNKGDEIEILSGPFSGLRGIYQTSSGEERSLILIEFLGQQSQLDLENNQIRS